MLSTYIYKRFDPYNDILATEQTGKLPLFNNKISLISASSLGYDPTLSSSYFCKLTSSNGVDGAFNVCSVAYGYSGSNCTSESYAIYNQFTNFFVGRQGTNSCDFDSGPQMPHVSSSIVGHQYHSYVSGFNAITLYRERFQDQLEPGTWRIDIHSSGNSENTWSFVDGAATSSNPIVRYGLRGRWDYIYSGTNKVNLTFGVHSSSDTFGLVFYDYGTFIFNAGYSVGLMTGWWTGGPSTAPNAINAMSAVTMAASGIAQMVGYGTTRLKSSLYFCRLNNKEFNFSQNPTYYNQSTGLISNADLKNNPRTYITTIGLYNDQDDLIAVGKLETPQEKNHKKEMILCARIDV